MKPGEMQLTRQKSTHSTDKHFASCTTPALEALYYPISILADFQLRTRHTEIVSYRGLFLRNVDQRCTHGRRENHVSAALLLENPRS